MSDIGLRILGGIFLAVFISTIVRKVIKPTPKLAARVRPYTATARSAMGRTPDRSILLGRERVQPSGVLQRLSRPLAEALVRYITRIFGTAFKDDSLALKIRQSGLLLDVPEQDRVHEYRVRQVGAALGWAVIAGVGGQALGFPPIAVLGLCALGAFVGASRRSGSLGSRVEDQRARMRIEIYTVNQLLAIYLRTSGSPVLAAQRLVRRGRGAVIDELNEALRLHARGMSASKAFDRIAETSPEPFAARTYKLLASGSERGADLATALLGLSEDVRDARRTELRRGATKRQGAMLVPILVFLAPVMLLFIAAPLPTLLTHVTH